MDLFSTCLLTYATLTGHGQSWSSPSIMTWNWDSTKVCFERGRAGWPGPYPHVCSTSQIAAAWVATEGNSLCSHNVVSRSDLSRSHTAERGHLAPWSPSALCGTSYPHDPKRHGVNGMRVGWEDEWQNEGIKEAEEERVWWVDDEGWLITTRWQESLKLLNNTNSSSNRKVFKFKFLSHECIKKAHCRH